MHFILLWIKHCFLPTLLPQLGQLHVQRGNLVARRRKKSIVKNVWLISGTTMLLNPALYVVLPVFLFTTFISFSILDETP